MKGPSRLLLAGALVAAACVRELPPPDVVLVTADTLRADHLSINGYPRATSPNIDRFAREAWHFTQAITVIPKTGPAFISLFTGQHPRRHGVRSNASRVPDAFPMLAERLRTEGYRTAAFVSNPAVRGARGFSRGFETFEERFEGDGVSAVNAAFREWVAGGWSHPTFVWIHYIDPHGPYDPPADLERLFIDDEWAGSTERVSLDYEARQVEGGAPNKILGAVPLYQQRDREDRVAAYVARYDAEIRHVDAAFGEVVQELERLDRLQDALVIFTSDHGESLGEHNYYFEHGWFAYDATLRVPLMVKLPDQSEGGIVDAQVSVLDVVPTIGAVLGRLWEPGGPGGNLFGTPKSRPLLAVESAGRYPVKYRGLRSTRWKYLTGRDGSEELYDLKADPGETENLAREESTALVELRGRLPEILFALRSGSPPAPPSEDVEMDARVREQLKALGYLE